MTESQAKKAKAWLKVLGYRDVHAHEWKVAGVKQRDSQGDVEHCVSVYDAGLQCVDLEAVVSLSAESLGYRLEPLE